MLISKKTTSNLVDKVSLLLENAKEFADNAEAANNQNSSKRNKPDDFLIQKRLAADQERKKQVAAFEKELDTLFAEQDNTLTEILQIQENAKFERLKKELFAVPQEKLQRERKVVFLDELAGQNFYRQYDRSLSRRTNSKEINKIANNEIFVMRKAQDNAENFNFKLCVVMLGMSGFCILLQLLNFLNQQQINNNSVKITPRTM